MGRKRVTDGGAVMQWMDEQLAGPALRARVDELQRGLTQVQPAQRAGLSQSMIAKLESGKVQNYELRTLVRIAAAAGANVRVTFEPLRRAKATRKHAAA